MQLTCPLFALFPRILLCAWSPYADKYGQFSRLRFGAGLLVVCRSFSLFPLSTPFKMTAMLGGRRFQCFLAMSAASAAHSVLFSRNSERVASRP
jgi:hypothetical protein